jgi:hypothetical protein
LNGNVLCLIIVMITHIANKENYAWWLDIFVCLCESHYSEKRTSLHSMQHV